jgi:hypothetical protein
MADRPICRSVKPYNRDSAEKAKDQVDDEEPMGMLSESLIEKRTAGKIKTSKRLLRKIAPPAASQNLDAIGGQPT